LAKRILVPIDGSNLMEKKISYACEAAKNTRPFGEAGLRIIERAEQIAKNMGVDSETRLERTFGNAAQAILKAAEEGKFDLIVIGAKGHNLLANLMVGSVCDTVVRNAPCPVLVVR